MTNNPCRNVSMSAALPCRHALQALLSPALQCFDAFDAHPQRQGRMKRFRLEAVRKRGVGRAPLALDASQRGAAAPVLVEQGLEKSACGREITQFTEEVQLRDMRVALVAG